PLLTHSRSTCVTRTAVPTKGLPRKVDINGRVVPIATAELSLFQDRRMQSDQVDLHGNRKDLYSIQLSCYCNGVHGIAFAQSTSEIFATCRYGDIRLWHLRSGNELVRIEVPNVTCLCVCFIPSGTEVISGWSDRMIGSFGSDGGSEGQVRLWKLGRDSQQIVATMKEHRIAVTAVRVTQVDLECVSSGSDGQMLTWSLTRHIRLKQMIKTANFQGVYYLPVDQQFVACGLDRFAKYFNAFEMKQLREVELSDKELFDIAVDSSEMRYSRPSSHGLLDLPSIWH
ncbi:MAG: putative WD repeat domain 16, partial [Streblomastix strix]